MRDDEECNGGTMANDLHVSTEDDPHGSDTVTAKNSRSATLT